jgi:superfamily I DNA/RNA helicase
MSKMSQLHAELSEQAYELGFDSIEEAEANGVKIQYNADGTATLVPFLTDKEQEMAEQNRRDEILNKIDEAIGYIRFYDNKDSDEHINNLLKVEEYIKNN